MQKMSHMWSSSLSPIRWHSIEIWWTFFPSAVLHPQEQVWKGIQSTYVSELMLSAQMYNLEEFQESMLTALCQVEKCRKLYCRVQECILIWLAWKVGNSYNQYCRKYVVTATDSIRHTVIAAPVQKKLGMQL